jgi:hypothetical protein
VLGRTAAVANFLRVVPDWKGATKNAFYVSFLPPQAFDQYLPAQYQNKVAVHTWAGTALSYQILKTTSRVVLSPGALPAGWPERRTTACCCASCVRA